MSTHTPRLQATESMTQKALTTCICLAWVGAIGFEASRSVHASARAVTTAQTPARSAAPTTPARELVTKYCVTCHNDRLKTANLSLDKADTEQVFNSAETWEKVVVKLRSRAMPPPGSRRPDNATYDAVAAWLETELDRAALAHPNPGRPANLHRLNRTEYANAVRDLLGVEIDATSMLPPDAQAYGFDTNADALSHGAGAARSVSDRGGEDRPPRHRRSDRSARRSSATPPSRATPTNRPGCGRPTAWAKTFRWARGAGSPRDTFSRWMASMSSRFGWQGPTPT